MFTSPAFLYRLTKGGPHAVCKATGAYKHPDYHICDATAGWGEDGMIIAHAGPRVTMVERNPQMAARLSEAIKNAQEHVKKTEPNESNEDFSSPSKKEFPAHFAQTLSRITLVHADAIHYLKEHPHQFDCVYLDPMFPKSKSSAKVKKKMQLLHDAIGEDTDTDALFDAALIAATKRVVVKRPSGAPSLKNATPDAIYKGKSVRFDVYNIV